MYDSDGQLVWIERHYGMIMDLNVQRYRDEDFLTFWIGEDDGTRGLGHYYMLNSSYELAHVVSAKNGLAGDVHEFKISNDDTAIMSIYEICQMDLTPVGKAVDGWVYDGLFQEIDIETGELRFEWRARDHYAVNETYFPIGDKGDAPTKDAAFDYFHINSIDKNAAGYYLVSSRYMHTVTCVSPSGEIAWILGGKRNMFEDLSGGAATDFTWQHDARWSTDNDNIITLYDNGATEHISTAPYSRGLMIELDFTAMTARTLHVYESPGHFSSHSQGNLQVLPQTGNVFIGWGKASAYTEFSPAGDVLCDVHWGPSMFFWFGWVKSYRAQKVRWVGRPSWPPDLHVAGRSLYVSWNGATEVAGWVLQRAGRPRAQDAEFETVDYMPKTDFETRMDFGKDVDGFLRVAAVDVDGEHLGYTRVFEGDSGQMVPLPFVNKYTSTADKTRSQVPSSPRQT